MVRGSGKFWTLSTDEQDADGALATSSELLNDYCVEEVSVFQSHTLVSDWLGRKRGLEDVRPSGHARRRSD